MGTKIKESFLRIIRKYSAKIFSIIFIGIAGISIINIFFQEDKPFKKDSPLLIIIPDTNRFVISTDRQWRIQYLSEIVMQHQSSYAQVQLTHSSDKLQTRLAFVALYAVMLIPFLSSKRKTKRIFIVWAAFIFFLGFYGYEIHASDLDSRLDFKVRCIDSTLNVLSTINTTDSTWYDISLVKIRGWEEDVSTKSCVRKLYYFFRPDLSQIAYYFIPFAVVLSLFLVNPKPKKV